MTTIQEQVKAILEGQEAKGYLVRSISEFTHCTKCGKDSGPYSGRTAKVKTLDECIEKVGDFETDVEIFNNLQIGESADDKDIIAVEIIGHAATNGCRKCNEKKGENEMTKKMKKSELEVLVAKQEEMLKKQQAQIEALLAERDTLLKKDAPAEVKTKAATKKEIVKFENAITTMNDTKVMITRMNVNGLDTGLIKFNKYSWTYSWNKSKYNKPLIKGEGFKPSMSSKIADMLTEVFKTSTIYIPKAKAEVKTEAAEPVDVAALYE